jgi:hypothetical protein
MVRLFRTDGHFFILIDRSCAKLNQDHESEADFNHILSTLAKLIESNTSEDKSLAKSAQKEDSTNKRLGRSITCMAYLFRTTGLPDKKPFEPLRNINSLRNKTFHNAEGDTIELLEEFGLQYPIIDYQDAARKLIEAYLACIIDLCDTLKKYRENSFNTHNSYKALG